MDNNQLPPGIIVVAGATGALGRRIVHHLRLRGAEVRALVRAGAANDALADLGKSGARIVPVDYADRNGLTEACRGATCVVSALSGLRDTIVEIQSRLLEAAVGGGVARFIPSDFCIDFTKLPAGSNRNLDLRREFADRLDAARIGATSILNGMFADLLTGQAPVVLFGPHRVLYWGRPDVPMDFTTMEDTAAFTAAAALDPSTPRWLRIAGEAADVHGLVRAAEDATGTNFRPLRAGSLKAFGRMIRITRVLFPKKKEVFPPWQGMQYLHNMFTGKPKLFPLDNARYPELTWTPLREVLQQRAKH
ncbi:NmrA family NAD(P)-binding protein [Flaviaesturariibacter amylovorans]|uniref:NmrA-like domain-containing protein n=1 Tax=Flaviaesturariibacter amylovorans TaxID=1084520 RepID=A0ABP8G8J9_9BACT